MQVSHRAQYPASGSGTHKWNSAFIHGISYTSAFHAMSSQNVCYGKDLLAISCVMSSVPLLHINSFLLFMQ